MRRAHLPAPPPMETNERVVTGMITIGWAIALVTLVLLRGSLPEGERWWIWTCATGFGMGLFGLWYVPHLKRARARTEQRRVAAEGGAQDPPADRR
jgi:hypothetical protein